MTLFYHLEPIENLITNEIPGFLWQSTGSFSNLKYNLNIFIVFFFNILNLAFSDHMIHMKIRVKLGKIISGKFSRVSIERVF